MADHGALATIASIVAAVGTLVLSFRIQGERAGISWADRLLIGATLSCLWLVILPLVSLPHPWPWAVALERAAGTAGVILLSGYLVALLAHYRLLSSGKQAGSPGNPEPAERMAFWITLVVAAAVFACLFISIYGGLNEASL